jgi:uncharacterized protein involved in exopolysaccharide biosynthesis
MSEQDEKMQTSTSSSDVSLRELVTPLIRRRGALAIGFVSILVIMLGWAALTGPSYSAHTAFLVDRERADPLVTTESTAQMAVISAPITEEEVNSEVELLKSRDLLEKVVIANGLDKSHGFSLGDLLHPNQSPEDRVARAVKALAMKLKVENVTKTNVIDVKYSSADPQLAYGVLKSLGDFYTQKHMAVHRPAGSYEFFAGETERYRKALEAAEGDLRNLGQSTGVAAPDAQRNNLALQVANSIGRLHTAEEAIAADEERIRNDQEQMGTTPKRSSTVQTSTAADKLLTELNATLLAQQNKRTALALKYDPSYPLVKEADEELAQAKQALERAEKTRYLTESTDLDPTYELLREDLAKAKADHAAQAATLAATKHSIESMQGQMVELDQESLTQQDLLREVKADENNYLLYLGKREQERTSDALDTTRIANVAIAVPPAIPVLPVFSWPLILAISFGTALVLSVGMAYAVDYLDPSFHSSNQVVETLGIPVVVVLPKRVA